jgi:hypothetical protein
MNNSQIRPTLKRTFTKRHRERRAVFILLGATLLMAFSLGIVFGCFLSSVFATENNVKPLPISEIEIPTISEIETPTLYEIAITGESRTLDKELQRTMIDMCKKYNVPFALAVAVAEQESQFNPDAKSKTSDYGMMQINKINFGWLRKMGIEPLDHKGNIEAGVLMLSEAIKKHNGYGLAVMAYNCGDAGAKKLWQKGICETAYSKAVMERYHKWNSYLGGM